MELDLRQCTMDHFTIVKEPPYPPRKKWPSFGGDATYRLTDPKPRARGRQQETISALSNNTMTNQDKKSAFGQKTSYNIKVWIPNHVWRYVFEIRLVTALFTIFLSRHAEKRLIEWTYQDRILHCYVGCIWKVSLDRIYWPWRHALVRAFFSSSLLEL